MSQLDTREEKDTEGKKQPIDYPDPTEIHWFTIVGVIIGGIAGIVAFVHLVIEMFFKR